MSTVTLMQLRRRTRSRLGVPLTDRFFTDDVLDDAVNLAADVLDSEQRWPWHERLATFDTVAGTSSYATPDDWRATRSIFYTDDELAFMSPGDLMLRPTNQQGRPAVWSVVGDAIWLRPVPDAVYSLTHFYYRERTTLVEDDDVLDMPGQYSGAVVAKAAELLSIREDDQGAAAAHLAEYVTWLARMRREVRRTTGPITPRVREGSWV